MALDLNKLKNFYLQKLQPTVKKVSNLSNSYVNNVAKPMAVGTPQVRQGIKAVGNYFNPQDQRAYVDAFYNKINNIPRYQLPQKMSIGGNQFLPTNTNNKVLNFASGLGRGVIESGINAAPNLIKGYGRIEKEKINLLRGDKVNWGNALAGTGNILEGGTDIAGLGIGKKILKNAGQETFEQGFKQVLKKGIKEGAGIGALGGASYGVGNQYNKKFDVGEVALNTVAGTLLGGALGGVTAGIGSVLKTPNYNTELRTYLRNAMGQFRAGDVPVKPPMMPKPQWDYQLKINKELGRNPYEPIMPEDLQKIIKNKGGLSVKPLTKFEHDQSVANKAGSIDPQARTDQLETVGEIASERVKNIRASIAGEMQPNLKPQSSQTSHQNISIKDVENKIYGNPTEITPTGTKKSVGFIGDQFRKLEQGISSRVERGLTSQNSIVRTMATVVQDLIGGAGKSADQITARSNYRGGIDYGTKLASDTQNKIYGMLGNDPKALERVHAVLDPEISKIKVNEADLTPAEKEAAGILRVVSDFINDANYEMGFISKEKWQSNQGGKYIARAYEPFDYPPEVADFVKDKSIKFDLNPFKQRGDVTDWKVENAINDPAYLMGKRLQQTMFNQEVRRYMDWAKTAGLTSDVAAPGYIQLSDDKSYGDLAGKWIRKDALEDVKGFFMTNDVAQKAYDVLNWYDRNPIRRNLKALKTVFNPAVRLGNKTGNYVFAWLNGINPVTFTKNKVWANTALKNNDPLYRYAVQRGLMGTDVTKADIARISAELTQGVTDKNVLQKISEWAGESYGRVDDTSKLAALKTWIDRGVDVEEAVNRVQRGFQDYNMVGMLYDIGAKLPVLGNPFVRFASESVRIAKNAIVDHPIRAVATVAAWKLFTDVMSRISGETEGDRQTREQRVGASHLPFTDISTNVQTPWGEVNVSRLLGFSTTFTPEDATLSDLSKYSPIQNPLDARNYGSDPLIGPPISVAMDKDFRGKSIADPNQNKYTGSTLTPTEQNLNRLGYLGRSYAPPSATDAYNITKAVQGEPNVYGQVKTPLQAALRTYPGVKVEQFGAKEAQATREKNAYFEGLKQESNQSKANAVTKQLLQGKITPEQANKRVGYFLGQNKAPDTQVKQIGNGVVQVGQTFNYLDDKGSQQTIDLGKVIEKPQLTGDKLYDKKLLSKYNGSVTSQQNDIIKLAELGVIPKDEAIKAVNGLEKTRIKSGKTKLKKLTAPKIKVKKISFKVPKIKVRKAKRRSYGRIKVKKIKI